tara:strand:- start:321 stop:521 length:201 start_codon:yes stop_codon:yes gene_type:complete
MENLLELQRMVQDLSRDLQGLNRMQLRDGLDRLRRTLEMVVEDTDDSDSLELSRTTLNRVRRELAQ